jgi:peroxin-4
MVHNRLLKEFRELCDPTKTDPDIELALEDEADIFVWSAQLRGPADSPYEDGLFKLHIKCPPNYPLAPPKVSFVTPIFHPNVLFKTGEICLDILKPDSWTPAWTLQSVCRAVTALLSHPEADSPLNCDCGAPLSPAILPLPAILAVCVCPPRSGPPSAGLLPHSAPCACACPQAI